MTDQLRPWRPTRASFLRAAAATGAGLALGGCDLFSTAPESRTPAGGGGDGAGGGAVAKEAPQLAALVKSGDLPELADRLPERPLVVRPVDRPGQYGGTWHSLLVGGDYSAWMDRQQRYHGLVRYDPAWKKIIPDLAESYDVRAGGKEYVFHLRPGVKWSDGHPFSADDIVFWYRDVFMNKELTPVQETLLLSANKPPVVEKQDDDTVVFRYDTPHGLLPRYLAGGAGDELLNKPRHYLQQFHKRHNPDGIDELVQDAKFDTWVQLFLDRADWSINPDLPVLSAWQTRTPLSGGKNHIVAKRNPYYWKVDTDGRQLPYIDEIDYQVISDLETALLKAQNGEFDMLSRHINTLQNKPVLARSRSTGNFDFFELESELVNGATLTLNLTHKDPVKREIFGNKDFRIGLSYALNRQEIIDIVYQGQGEPWQMSPRRESGYYNEKLAKQYVEHDVAKANEHLDRAGYAQRDGAGIRLGPDGKPITIRLECTDQWDSPVLTDVAELVVGYWKKVGIDAQEKNQSASLLAERTAANDPDATVDVDFGGLNILMDPRAVFPHHGTEHFVPWITWYESAGKDGEQPPAPVRRQMKLYDEIRTTLDEGRQHELMTQIIAIAADEFDLMGVILPAAGYGIVRGNFHNVPPTMIDSTGAWYPTPGPTNPPQYFMT